LVRICPHNSRSFRLQLTGDFFRRVALGISDDVSVDAERNLGIGVAELGLRDGWPCSRFEQKTRVCATKGTGARARGNSRSPEDEFRPAFYNASNQHHEPQSFGNVAI
jgi:hypothetical protein